MEEGIMVSEKPEQMSSVSVSLMTNRTPEQQKELLMMQIQHERFILQRVWWKIFRSPTFLNSKKKTQIYQDSAHT